MSLYDTFILLFSAIIGYIVSRKVFGTILPEISKSFKYRKMLYHLYKAIKQSELNVNVAMIGIKTCDSDNDENAKNNMINATKEDIKATSDCFNKMISMVKNEPTKYGCVIYEKLYNKCISSATSLRDMYCKNFAQYY